MKLFKLFAEFARLKSFINKLVKLNIIPKNLLDNFDLMIEKNACLNLKVINNLNGNFYNEI